MSDTFCKEEEDENDEMLLEDLVEDGGNNQQSSSVIDADDEMLLLSSSPSSEPGKTTVVPKAKPGGVQSSSRSATNLAAAGNNNIVIEDSDLDSGEENSVEVIGSDEEEMDEEDDFDEDEIEDSESDESQSLFLDGKVQIFMAQGSFFIWNAEDVQVLREESRIVGKLAGCLPRAPRQNNQLGLPLQLMPEEAKLLEEIEVGCVVEELDASDDVEEMRKKSFEAMREQNYMLQKRLYKESRKEEVLKLKDEIIKGKKAKKRKLQELQKDESTLSKSKKQEQQIDPASVDSQKVNEERLESKPSDNEMNLSEESTTKCGDTDTDLSSTKQLNIDHDKDEENSGDNVQGASSREKDDCVIIPSVNKDNDDNDDEKDDEEEEEEDFNVDALVTTETHIKHSMVQLFTENPWRQNVKRPKHWIFPLSQKEFLRYEVFRDLWKKGYFLTSGSKFGGDFLVYPGDPARFHSHFIAVCIDKTVDLSALDIISLGRLGSNVRKTVLLCAMNKTRQIVYTSLQWTGIS